MTRSSPPGMGPRTIRKGTLLVLALVNVAAALILLARTLVFVLDPDPAVKAGAMYVTLALCTMSGVLMAVMAVNIAIFRFMTRQQQRDMRLVAWATGGTGMVTGVLTVGTAAQTVVMPLFVGAIAFVFIWVQDARIDRAQRTGASQGSGAAPRAWRGTGGTGAKREKTRQRRGGRKR